MNPIRSLILVSVLPLLCSSPSLLAQDATTPEASQPALDPATVSWPRTFTVGAEEFAVFQPQISTWTGNQISGRFAVGVRATGSKEESYGTVAYSARTEIDKPNRLVTMEDFMLSDANFPTQPDKNSDYLKILGAHLPQAAKTIPLDHLESVFVVSGEVKKQVAVDVKNTPPRMIYTTQPSVLVLIDGPPVLKPLDKVYQRVINTPALLLLNTINSKYYAYASSTWYNSPSIEGPFVSDPNPPADIEEALKLALATKKVDPMDATGDETPALHLYTSSEAAELVQTTGMAQVVPVEGTNDLLYVTNTNNALFMDDQDDLYYALISGRWFSASSLYGPWTFVSSSDLPSDFQRIPVDHPKSNVLASVVGTPQSREAVIASSIPQTATVDRSKATLTVNYNGEPDFVPIEGTSLDYAKNSVTPVIMLNAHAYYANEGGLWFDSTSPEGPWAAATYVPDEIYTIPPSSPIFYVTSCYVYGFTPEDVYTGYTPGYTGAVVSTDGVVVNGTGYVYPPVIIDDNWIGYPPTYGYGWGMAVGAYTAFAYGFAAGVDYGCWAHPYWGGYGHGWGYGYSHVNVNSTSFYNHWGTAVRSTGVSGYNAWTGNSFAGQRATAFNPYTGARAAGSRGAVSNAYTGNYAAGRQGAGYNPSTGRFAAGQQGVVGNAYTGNAAGVNRGVAGNVKTGNAVAWNNGNVMTDHQGNIHSLSADGNYNSYDRSGWNNNTTAASSWGNRSWNQSSSGSLSDRSSNGFGQSNDGFSSPLNRNSSDSLGSQRFGQSLGSQRFGGFRDSGGGGFGGGGRRFGGGGFGGRRR
ncbi:carbohydrate-binding family V/XII [Haloferula sp.]|uniref:carbohydrate-binding family V/XII n=1 Tax=Haloferula sp. TaxID=2497595 RepID=UPI003C771663